MQSFAAWMGMPDRADLVTFKSGGRGLRVVFQVLERDGWTDFPTMAFGSDEKFEKLAAAVEEYRGQLVRAHGNLSVREYVTRGNEPGYATDVRLEAITPIPELAARRRGPAHKETDDADEPYFPPGVDQSKATDGATDSDVPF